jgi:hypothetical protein
MKGPKQHFCSASHALTILSRLMRLHSTGIVAMPRAPAVSPGDPVFGGVTQFDVLWHLLLKGDFSLNVTIPVGDTA